MSYDTHYNLSINFIYILQEDNGPTEHVLVGAL